MGEKYLIINGKRYISSRRASESSGYTLDYIGQLARGGKIQSKMVGRVRFIDEYSLEQYILFPNGNNDIDKGTSIRNEEEIKKIPNQKSIENIKIISSIRDHDNTFRNKDRIKNKLLSNIRVVSAVASIIGLSLFLSTTMGIAGFKSFLSPFDGLGALVVEISNTNQNASIAESVIFTGKEADRIYLGFLHKIDLAILGTARGVRQLILSWLEQGTNYLARIRKGQTVVEQQIVTTTEKTDDDLAQYQTLTEEEIRKIINELVQEELEARAKKESIRGSGLVVVPSTGNSASDELIKQRVANSFSDEVEITLDPSKTTGILRPVFRDRVGEDFLFMLVPVN